MRDWEKSIRKRLSRLRDRAQKLGRKGCDVRTARLVLWSQGGASIGLTVIKQPGLPLEELWLGEGVNVDGAFKTARKHLAEGFGSKRPLLKRRKAKKQHGLLH